MPYLTSHLLDRCNEWVVRWRLRGRLQAGSGPPAHEILGALGDAVHPAPDGLASLQPVQAAGDLWHAASPWPDAAGANQDWHAARIAAAAADGSATGARPPALILLHGWLMDRPQELVYRSWARRAARRGIEVWLPRLPFHRERAEPGEVSGQRCLSPDLSASLDAVRQATAETRLLAEWLRRRGAPRVGLWGMSLGAWVAALAATLDEEWDGLVLWAPVAEPIMVLWESGLVASLRAAVSAGGMSAADFESDAFDTLTPARRASRVPRDRTLVIAGIHDQVVAAASIRRLALRWGVDVRWTPHGHISLMASRRPVVDSVSFLAAALFAPTCLVSDHVSSSR